MKFFIKPTKLAGVSDEKLAKAIPFHVVHVYAA